MKRSVYVLGLALLAMAATLAQADPVDPVFSMDDPTTGTPVTSQNFAFGSDPAGGGVFAFVNNSGILWQNLEITVIEPTNSAITILPGLFFNTEQFSSAPMSNGMSLFTIGLFNTGAGSGGIANNQFFTINLNDLVNNAQPSDPNGAGGWGPDADFTAAANALPGAPGTPVSPEPASMLLIATGLGLVWFGARRFSGASR
jgi:hypothetical protein